MSLITIGSIKDRSIQEIYDGNYSFEEVITELYQTINCSSQAGQVCRDVSDVEYAIITIECSKLAALKKNMKEYGGHTFEIISAIVRYIESNGCKDTEVFILGL